MTAYLLPGVMGLLIGMLLHWAGFSQPGGLRWGLGLRRSTELRSGLAAFGYGLMITALLCWLAVIDVDEIRVLPLSLGTIIGGMLMGLCCGLSGFTPMTSFAAAGGGSPAASVVLEALSVLLGCFGMTQLLPKLSGLLKPLHTAPPYSAATLFQVTLDEPWLLEGGYLGLGCVGLLMVAIAICIPNPRVIMLTDEAVMQAAQALAEQPSAPEDAPADAFVALLEGEEPLVVDTDAPCAEGSIDEPDSDVADELQDSENEAESP